MNNFENDKRKYKFLCSLQCTCGCLTLLSLTIPVFDFGTKKYSALDFITDIPGVAVLMLICSLLFILLSAFSAIDRMIPFCIGCASAAGFAALLSVYNIISADSAGEYVFSPITLIPLVPMCVELLVSITVMKSGKQLNNLITKQTR